MVTSDSAVARCPSLDYDPGPVWRVRFWTVFIGQSFSSIGGALTQFVLVWWIAGGANSVATLTTVSLFATLPHALLGPLGGTLVDRYNRRRIMLSAGLGRAICMSVLITLFLTGEVEYWHLCIIVFIRGSLSVFQRSAATASIAMLVPKSFLSKAAGLNQTISGIVIVGAAPLGALAIGVMPIGYTLGIDLVTTILGVLTLSIYPIPQRFEHDKGVPSLWRELCDGVQVIWDDHGLRQIFGLLATLALIAVPALTLVLLLVKQHFGGDATHGALMGSADGIGIAIGGMLVAAMPPPKKRIPWILGGFAVSCIAVCLTALVPATTFWLAISFWLINGIAFSVSNALFIAFLQSWVPNHLQGRVLSSLGTIMGFAGPVGLAIATVLGERISVRWLFVAAGAVGSVIALLGFLSPAIRSMEASSQAGEAM